eukprot:m.219460 g.219460  ORF g.219460 m.219460 type:complete len:320 (-) comp10165_c0_seq1:145-1104(-)
MQQSVVAVLIAAFALACAAPVEEVTTTPGAPTGIPSNRPHYPADIEFLPLPDSQRDALKQNISSHISAMDAGRAARRAAAAAGGKDRRDLWIGHTPYAAPQYFPRSVAVIIVMWDVTEYNGQDMDSIIITPSGCIVAAKGAGGNGGWCVNSPGWAQLGYVTPIYWQPYGGSYVGINFPTADSYAGYTPTDYATYPAGAEVLTIYQPETTGPYKHVVYNYASSIGYHDFESPSVVFWGFHPYYNGPAGFYQSYSYYATNSQVCEGRFWNTFSVTFTMSSDDDAIASWSFSPIETVTATPLTTFGTTSWQNFETTRTTIGC